MSCDTIYILVCTYQGEQFIAEQLDSIVAQTYLDFEVHIFDDGSTDSTVSIVKRYCKTHPKLFLNKNKSQLGFLKNFENAINNVKGQYIALCDQDDIWLSNKLERCMKEMKLLEQQFPSSPVLVHSDLSLIGFSGEFLFSSFFASKKISLPEEKSRSNIMGHCGVMGNTILMNQLLIKAALPFPEGLKYHDYWLALVNEFFGVRKTIKEPLVSYRIHQDNVSNNRIERKEPWFPSRWLKLRFALPFLDDCRAETIRYFLNHYRFTSEDKALVERFYQYLLFEGSRLSHYIFLSRNDFLKPDLLYRISVFFRMMLTTRYAGNALSAQQIKRKNSE